MNNLQSYSPLSRPLEFDSLASRQGCEVVFGSDYLGWQSFEELCVFPHDTISPVWNQPDTVSYFYGPVSTGDLTHPFFTLWSAWVGSTGVRIGAVGAVVPPQDDLGVLSGLYPTTTPSKLSAAFNDEGLLAIAIQVTPGTIELKRYTATDGTTHTLTWPGASCLLFNNSLLDISIASKSGIVAFYTRPEIPNTLFGRFERDTTPYGTEHTLMPDLRAAPLRLIAAIPLEGVQILRYRDTEGRDAKLTSPLYITNIDVENKVPLTVALAPSLAIKTGILAIPATDKGKVTVLLTSGIAYSAAQKPADDIEPDNFALSVELESGEVIKP